jgi:hypothetical protein
VLAHASGEWIASDWPVCAVGETATPHRMGAALTYARRYALFTLVGIAGEDDLDAPDLAVPDSQAGQIEQGFGNGSSGRNGRGNRAIGPTSRRAAAQKPRPSPLDGQASVELRDSLVAEIHALSGSVEATAWAQRRMADKNRLSAADARKVEEAFRRGLLSFSTDESVRLSRPRSRKAARARQGSSVDKSALAFPEPRRVRDRDHVRSVAQKPCLVCGRRPSDPHHLRFAQSRAMARKVSDEFTVPLCRGHHRELHRSGDEAAWWRKLGIDPAVAARILWLESHPLPSTGGALASKPPDVTGRQRADLRNEAN